MKPKTKDNDDEDDGSFSLKGTTRVDCLHYEVVGLNGHASSPGI